MTLQALKERIGGTSADVIPDSDPVRRLSICDVASYVLYHRVTTRLWRLCLLLQRPVSLRQVIHFTWLDSTRVDEIIFISKDEANDRRSPERKLANSLFLVVKRNREKCPWQFPQGKWLEGETLRQVVTLLTCEASPYCLCHYFVLIPLIYRPRSELMIDLSVKSVAGLWAILLLAITVTLTPRRCSCRESSTAPRCSSTARSWSKDLSNWRLDSTKTMHGSQGECKCNAEMPGYGWLSLPFL